MPFTVIYEPVVVNKDIPAIPAANKSQIMRAIDERLAIAPLVSG